MPKLKSTGKMWSKKESESEFKPEQIQFISETLHVSTQRAIELAQLIGEEEIITSMKSRGGKTK